MYALTPRQHATVLAALRFWQGVRKHDDCIDQAEADSLHEIATSHGTLPFMDEAEIDQLCEELNTREQLGGPVGHLNLYHRSWNGKFIQIDAIVVGSKDANDYMTTHPDASLLALAPGEVALLADQNDTGVDKDKVPHANR